MTNKAFQETLITAIEDKGINLTKLSEQSRVPERYLNLLLEGNYSDLPASPYLHGYITRLANILEIDHNLLWQIFKKDYQVKSSGREDKLPPNRFALEPSNNIWLIVSVIGALLIIGYVTIRFDALIGRPDLTVSSPATDTLTTDQMFYALVGITDPSVKLTINNEAVEISPDGHFTKEALLESGINSFSIKASKFLGQSTIIRRQIIYQTPSETNSVSSGSLENNSSLPDNSSSSPDNL